MAKSEWFSVDKEGLRKLLSGRPKWFILTELLQNAWDTTATEVKVVLQPHSRNLCYLEIEDNSESGFIDLSHAFTLFAESHKKSNPQKRGMFNLGEKLILALCQRATIQSTTGTLFFSEGKPRRSSRQCRVTGTRIECCLRMTKKDLEEVLKVVPLLIPPKNVFTIVNDVELSYKTPLRTFKAILPTRKGDSDGFVKQTNRITTLSVYHAEEDAYLFEMGIPVVKTGDKYHVDIGQKVLLNSDRDNVTPGYLQTIRTLVWNNTFDLLNTTQDVTSAWARAAASDERCSENAIKHALDLRFGTNRVAADPSDRDAEITAMEKGYSVVHGGSLSAGEWSNAKKAAAITPAGKAFPSSPERFVAGKPIPPNEWTIEQRYMIRHWQMVAKHLFDVELEIVPVFAPSNVATVANYGKLDGNWRRVMWNCSHGSLPKFIVPKAMNELLSWHDLMIHELAHELAGGHKTSEYHDAATRTGALFVSLCIAHPELFTVQHFSRPLII